MLRVTAYTGGTTVPSARFRVRQYIPELRRLGIDMSEAPARFGSYPPASRMLRPGWGLISVAERFGAAVGARNSGLTLLQREMISTLATVERFTKTPRVLDIDDAVWLSGGGRCVLSIARLCHTVICGNPYIADFFRQAAQRVTVLPTPVDTDRFRPASRPERDERVVCWSGTSSGFPFLQGIEGALSAALRGDPRRRLRIVSDRSPHLPSIPARQLEFIQWSEDVEVAAIQDADVAIMPLDDSPWARGKCSYKLLTYMACGIPVIATPVGMNAQVLASADLGMAARSSRDWSDSIEYLFAEPAIASAKGANGREVAVREYGLTKLAPRLAAVLHAAGAGAN